MFTCWHCNRTFKTVQALGGHHSALGIKAPKAPKTKRPQPDNTPADDPPPPDSFKASPVEGIMQKLVIPPLHGEHEAELYNTGFRHGVLCVIIGVRLAQELSSMAIAQAAPLIRMAQEMRQAEAQAARTAAEEAAQKAAHAVAERIIQNLKASPGDIATAPSPLQGMIARHLERYLTPLIEHVLAPYFPNPRPPTNSNPPTPTPPPTTN